MTPEETTVTHSRRLVWNGFKMVPAMSMQQTATLSGIPIAKVREIDHRLCKGAREASKASSHPTNLARRVER